MLDEQLTSGGPATAPLPHPHGRPLLDWRDEWTLDVEFMDDDHRHLAALLNEIARRWGPRGEDARLSADRGVPELLLNLLDDLGSHTREHFSREEAVMRTLRYPDLPAHKSEHDLLLAELTISVREIRERGSATIDFETLHGLKDWLVGHVLEMDRPLAAFLRGVRDDGIGDGG